ncbi:MAG TPA: hypothetical protein VF344_03275 [Candidatus Limnocylindrales bacterium]
MSEKMVRCGRCHEVFDADEGPCPKCGAPYRAPVAAPKVVEGSFVDLYSGTGFVAPPDPPAAPMGRRRNNNTLWIGGGAGLILVAIVVALAFSMGLGGSGDQSKGQLVVPVTPRPTPTPTLPPSITALMGHLNDTALSAHIIVVSRVNVNARMIGAGLTLTSFDGQISGSNESGTLTQSGASREIKLVDSIVYTRAPNGTWKISPSIASYLIIAPVFGITKPEMIQLIDQETKNGQILNHFQTTRWWAPDPSRLALTDLTRLSLAPDVNALDLWATTDGVPVTATFSGTNSASDGTKLVDVEVTYTFDQVGVPVSIGTPEPPPSPSKK